ncbi:M14 family metallopeptidase [Phytoactinopolyspora halotolerans]|uniref:Peptidase M14 n=1 Tax=Phytoactinopolyspora halotolerans TaxID=1981512 RepID=A0A6L9SBF3_9ACTN|nr:M14 family metallopeptidase [Phytoactinopolyspora halotolerans]NEE02596.1 peptidase M14 [Phytoactinopolyspora halotolerans]
MFLSRLRPTRNVLFSAGLATAIAASTLAAGPAGAEPDHAHCGSQTGDAGRPSWTDHAELGAKLAGLAERSDGLVSVEEIGRSNQGREIWAARVGAGERVVLAQSEIHGNEKTGTESLLSLLRTLAAPTPRAEQLREQVTVVVVPKMNPDASEIDRRGNDRSWADVVADFPQLATAEPAWNYYTGILQGDDYRERPGFDVNRDFHPDLDYVPAPEDFPGFSAAPGWYIHPESQAIRDLYVGLQAEFGTVDAFLDLHHQAPCYVVDGGDDRVTMSLSGKFVDIENHQEYNNGYDLDLSKQLTLAAYDELQQANSPFSNITLYPQGIDLPGTALGSFALNGSGTVLFEVRGQTHSWGAKQRGQLITAVERGVMGIIQAVADGSAREIDPGRYDDIPDRG